MEKEELVIFAGSLGELNSIDRKNQYCVVTPIDGARGGMIVVTGLSKDHTQYGLVDTIMMPSFVDLGKGMKFDGMETAKAVKTAFDSSIRMHMPPIDGVIRWQKTVETSHSDRAVVKESGIPVRRIITGMMG